MSATVLLQDSLRGAEVDVLVHASPAAYQRVAEVLTAAASYIQDAPVDVGRVDGVANIESNLATIQLVFLVCAVIALGVSALGILNIGLASVAERSHELVIRRAIGARRRDVLFQVLGGAMATGVIASVLAVAATAVAISVALPQLIPPDSAIEPSGIPWTACASGIVAALATSVVGSLAPALKASRLPVAQALRA
jgi:putative ABC transport system permease protein